MNTIQMNKPKQIRFIYETLREGLSEQYNSLELLQYANSLLELFHEEYEEGFTYNPLHDGGNIKDTYSLINSSYGELMYQERELLSQIYEFESDEFITNKSWKKNYLRGEYEY